MIWLSIDYDSTKNFNLFVLREIKNKKVKHNFHLFFYIMSKLKES